jgi:hypothetical protein
MAAGDGQDSSWGLAHLSGMPITLSFGLVLFGALILLVILRVVFADASFAVRGGVK